MSDTKHTLERIKYLATIGRITPSLHGYRRMAKYNLIFRELVEGVKDAVLIEDYPTFPRGACSLILQWDASGKPLHVLWGIEKDTEEPVVLITVYRPDPVRWSEDFKRRI